MVLRNTQLESFNPLTPYPRTDCTLGDHAGRNGPRDRPVGQASGRKRRIGKVLRAQGARPAASAQGSGYRQYAEETVDRIRFIKRARDLGFSLKEIAELLQLRIRSAGACAAVGRRGRTTIEASRCVAGYGCKCSWKYLTRAF
jgi:hypothetical protein